MAWKITFMSWQSCVPIELCWMYSAISKAMRRAGCMMYFHACQNSPGNVGMQRLLLALYPGAYAPGFTLSSASRTRIFTLSGLIVGKVHHPDVGFGGYVGEV